MRMAFLGAKYAIPAMRQAGGGSRGAVCSLTTFTAHQYAKDAIRCNAVHPGLIEIPIPDRFRSDSEIGHNKFGTAPLGKTVTVDDIAYGVLCLASDELTFTTGNELTIDGGAATLSTEPFR